VSSGERRVPDSLPAPELLRETAFGRRPRPFERRLRPVFARRRDVGSNWCGYDGRLRKARRVLSRPWL
jgi:hypothetical protein